MYKHDAFGPCSGTTFSPLSKVKFTIYAHLGAHADMRNFLIGLQHMGRDLEFIEGSGWFTRPFFITTDQQTMWEINYVCERYNRD